jgi:copper chaperone CopZ
MKKNIFITGLLFIILITTQLFAINNQTEKFKVWGNCGMCKKTIEKSLKIEGVKKANWDIKTKELTVIFDAKKTDLKSIQSAICAAGYDNEGCKANDAAYDKLHSCCKYERK